MEELYGTRYQSDSFSLINVGSGFHCLRSFSFFSLFALVAAIFLADPGLRDSVGELISWDCSQCIAQVRIGCQGF